MCTYPTVVRPKCRGVNFFTTFQPDEFLSSCKSLNSHPYAG